MYGLKSFTASLHVHTALSPCASAEMTPQAIIGEAIRQGIDLIAITDHNTVANVEAVQAAAEGSSVCVIAGMEVQTREDVHIVCLFGSLAQALAWQEIVFSSLPDRLNDERLFGQQTLLNAADQVIGKLDRMLLTSTDMGVNETVRMVKTLGGLCIPAHVDRPSYSLISHLGFIPPELDLKAVEISSRLSQAEVRERFPFLKDYILVTAADAHYLTDLSKGQTVFHMRNATLEELKLTFHHIAGRKVVMSG